MNMEGGGGSSITTARNNVHKHWPHDRQTSSSTTMRCHYLAYDEDAPNFWAQEEDQGQSNEGRQRKVEEFAHSILKTSSDDMFCEMHESKELEEGVAQNCEECNNS